MSEVCSTCNRHSIKLHPLGDTGRQGCELCRTLDRLRGLSNRCDPSFARDALNLLRDTESRLRDWVSFRGPPGGHYERTTDSSKDAPENIASTFKAPTSKARPKPSSESVNVVSSSSRGAIDSAGAKKKVRKKANKGKVRAEWQHQRHLIAKARHEQVTDDELEVLTSSGSDLDEDRRRERHFWIGLGVFLISCLGPGQFFVALHPEILVE